MGTRKPPLALLPLGLLCPAEIGHAQEDPEAAPAVSAPRFGYEEGFFVESADGAYRLEIEGLGQLRTSVFERGLAGRASRFEVERMRLEITAELDDLWKFRFEPQFKEESVELEEAWLGLTLAEDGPLLLVGRMKEPFSLEEMLPRKHLDYASFSILNQLVPAEDDGLTLLGRAGALDYGAAFYNGGGADETNSDKDAALRLVVHPWRSRPESALAGLQLGLAGTFGKAEAELEGQVLVTEALAPFVEFQPGSRADGDRTRLGAEAAWLRGPFALYAEAIQIEEEIAGSGGAAKARQSGWYVGGSWVLTGEEKSFEGVRPARPFVRREGRLSGTGAWQLAARYSELDLDDDYVNTGLFAAEAFPDSVSTLDLGLNWYATDHVRVKLHYLRTRFADSVEIAGETRDSEDAALLQVQLQF